MIRFARIIATWFGLGYVPKGPGTAGSLGAILIALALHEFRGATPLTFAALALLIAIPGLWAADAVVKQLAGDTIVPVTPRKEKIDPQIIVVDEVVGQWIALAGVLRFNWISWIAAFVLFRLFDIFKPPPVRQLENLPGAVGIIADDVMAGVYAALVLFAAGWFNLY
jgi:phosphatidylglycerophosphatase A